MVIITVVMVTDVVIYNYGQMSKTRTMVIEHQLDEKPTNINLTGETMFSYLIEKYVS